MADRLTFHSGYRNASGKAFNSKHNQRENFQKSTVDDKNVYVDFCGKVFKGATFSENEKLFYERFLGPHVKRQNEKAKARRQYGRIQTIADYREKHPPEEVLIYLGTENVDSTVLKAVFDDFKKWQFENCCIKDKVGVLPLNAAMHLDEATPHIHLRQVYIYKDKDNEWQISQNKALEVLGFQRPDTSKPVGKYNNAKMTFTATCREKLFEIARSHGVELVSEPLPKNEVGLPLKEYVQREQAREQARQEQMKYKKIINNLEHDTRLLMNKKEILNDDIKQLDANIASKKEYYETNYNDGVKLGYNAGYQEGHEKGYREGYQEGVVNGANSPMGRLNTCKRNIERKQENDTLNEAHNSYRGGSPKS